MRQGARARISNDTLVRVNHEVYFFAGEETKRAFEHEPWRWCGRVTDPVTLDRFVPEGGSPSLPYEGRKFFFAPKKSPLGETVIQKNRRACQMIWGSS